MSGSRRRLYLHAEQGAGDAIMMLRYLPMVRRLVDALTVEVTKPMVTLVEDVCASDPELADVRVAERGVKPAADAFDFQLSMLSLPAVFGTTLETVPKPLNWRPKRLDGGEIDVESGRIGLCWAGSPGHQNDRLRSMPFAAMFPLLDLAALHGLTFQSLQFGYEVSAPLDPCPMGDFLETARAIARCSVVATVDTSIAHLAGSIGTLTWLALPFIAEWRWMLDRLDSPWYESMTLFRQTTPNDWAGVIDRMIAPAKLVAELARIKGAA